MAGDTDDLIRQLCTRVDMIMEDASVAPLTISEADHITLKAKLRLLAKAAHAMSALISAAGVLSSSGDGE